MVLNFGDADTTQKATGATSAQIDFVCFICTSSSTAAVASLSLPLSLSPSLFLPLSHTTISPFLYLPFVFFRSYNEVFVQTAFIPYFPYVTYYFSICDHGPDALHAVIRDKTITTAPQSPPPPLEAK